MPSEISVTELLGLRDEEIKKLIKLGILEKNESLEELKKRKERGSIEGGEILEEINRRILEKVNDRYGKLWRWIAEQLMPATKQRSCGVEDAVQETLFALYLALEKPNKSFANGTHIKSWTTKVARNKAVDVIDHNAELEGASAVAVPLRKDGDGKSVEPNATVGDLANEHDWRELTPEEAAIFNLIVERSDELDQRVQTELTTWEKKEARVIEKYLDWCSYRKMGADFNFTEKQIRTITLHFKETQEIATLVNEIRLLLVDLATTAAKDASVTLDCRSQRLLADFRDKP